MASASRKRWLVLVLVCVLIVAVLAAAKFMQISRAMAFAASFPERSESVTAVTTSRSNWSRNYQTIGELKALQSLELRNQVDGHISKLGFAGGETVAAGQALLSLDATEEQARLSAVRAQLVLAETQLQRSEQLRRQKLTSKGDFDQANANVKVLAAEAAALQATIAKKQLDAQFAADTSLHDLQVGQYLPANTLITRLTGLQQDYWLDFELPQGKRPPAIDDTIMLSGPAIPDSSLQARIVSADATINSETRSRRFRALLEDAPTTLAAGAVLDISVPQQTLADVIRLPATAVRRDKSGPHVFVLEDAVDNNVADHRASRRDIVLAGTEGNYAFVLGGLQPGEQVATTGAFKLEDGLLTNIVERVPVAGNPSNVELP